MGFIIWALVGMLFIVGGIDFINSKEEVDFGLWANAKTAQIEVKNRKDSITGFEKGGRDDLVNQAKEEIAVLAEYLPKQLTKEELKEKLTKIIADLGATSIKDMGAVMKEAKAEIETAADGRTINEVVKELLS